LIKISKKSFLEKFYTDDSGIISNLYDKIVLSEKTGKSIFCDYFYTPNIWKKLLETEDSIGVKISTSGAFDDAERKMIAFNKESYANFPFKLICIKSLSRFSTPLHKDYLGSLMGLGIRREKLGDLICYDNLCIVPMCEDIHEYILFSFESAGKSPCSVNILDTESFLIHEPFFSEIMITCPSARLDAIVSSLCNCSRSNACEIICSGKVLVDYCECCFKDKKIEEGCIITIRGYGKFIIKEELGFTKSGNLKLKVKKYK
jgi:RNA-binding protein YlmH